MSKKRNTIFTDRLAFLLRRAGRQSYTSIVSCLGSPSLVACAWGIFRISWYDPPLARWVPPDGQDYSQLLRKDASPLFSDLSQIMDLWRQYEALPVRKVLTVNDNLSDKDIYEYPQRMETTLTGWGTGSTNLEFSPG